MISAKQLFQQYIALGHAFDPAVADLYADDALIQNTRTYPTGQKRILIMEAPQYKALIRQTMFAAKDRNDTSDYTDVAYALEGEKVRIMATRHSNLKDYDSPMSILVAKDQNEHWKITEEISESQP